MPYTDYSKPWYYGSDPYGTTTYTPPAYNSYGTGYVPYVPPGVLTPTLEDYYH